ncbi:MAG: dephospho-CoA kinase [Eubacteriales bacterium]|jgi:dephospho-CoA kinase|nr:dephospho-CoA kinase [Eubacteriales bacterium]MDY5932880.1 dephospho-CoA kinase [Eubacteriales bacterium]
MKVAVTGGIGAGKSEFMRAVKELGIRTYSADEINAELLRDKRYIEKLSEAFPLAVKDGKVDKSVLREEVFSDEKKRKTLNALAHPEIRRQIEEITGDAVIEVPLLFESGMTDLFDRVIVVTAGEDVRINRIVSTRNISKDLAKNIIKNQTTDDERLKRADYVAINDGTRKDLYEQAKNIIKRIFE